jgi:hypothetical protein
MEHHSTSLLGQHRRNSQSTHQSETHNRASGHDLESSGNGIVQNHRIIDPTVIRKKKTLLRSLNKLSTDNATFAGQGKQPQSQARETNGRKRKRNINRGKVKKT